MRRIERNWDAWMDEDYEIETLYQQSLTIVRVIEENRQLKAQNAALHQKLKDREGYIDSQYKQTMSQVGGILSALINKEEQPQ